MPGQSTSPSPSLGPWLRRSLTNTQLLLAWEKVRANHGVAGVDGQSVEDFGEHSQRNLKALRDAVVAGKYQRAPLLRLWMLRPEKTPRPLAVPTVTDRVLQTAAAMVLQPLFEAEFEDCSFAYRQGRSVRQAVARIERLQREGYRWVVDADIETFFDQIPHAPLLAELARLVQDDAMVQMVAEWLRAPVFDPAQDPQATLDSLPAVTRGVPQGSPISPMLSNLYLDHLDEALLAQDLALVRYADDFVILTRSEAQARDALLLTEQTLGELQLKLNSHKTRIVHLDQGFEFLGWSFVRSLAVPRTPDSASATPAETVRTRPPAPSVNAADGLSATTMQGALQEVSATDAIHEPGTEEPDFAGNSVDTLPPASPLQRTLYVVEVGSELVKESERLQLRKETQTLLSLPIIHVDQVFLFGQHSISTPAMHLCLKHRVPVVLLSKLGRYMGQIHAPDASHTRLLSAQVRAAGDPAFCLAMARHLVQAKLENSAVVLARYSRNHASGGPLRDTVLRLREDARRVKTAVDLDSLRGLEGQAARSYFAGMRMLLGSAWRFEARQKQPPPDPVNAMLSLGYTLLYHATAGLQQARGLNPYFGLFHATGGEHMALASDLMEEFRAVVVDATVLHLCLSERMSHTDFTVHGDSCSLSPDAIRRFIHSFEHKLGSANGMGEATGPAGARDLRRRIDLQVQRLVQALHANQPGGYQACGYR